MELSVEKEMCQMSDEQEDSLLEKTLKIKKEFVLRSQFGSHKYFSISRKCVWVTHS